MQRPIDLAERLAPGLGHGAVVAGEAIEARYSEDPSGKPGARPEIVFRPRDTAELSTILAACDAVRQPLVVQGGRTGLSGGARPLAGEAVLSLERLTRIEPVDAAASTIVAEAGVALQTVQEAADDAGLMFGVDIGARGSATIGGNVSTNAGGIRVLRYGMFRAQVLGLEAVLADGTILSSLKGLTKDNSGYDLGQWFIGSEGTLGVVTKACLKLHPKPASEANALLAVASLESAIHLLGRLRRALGQSLSAFEVIFASLYEALVERPGATMPLRPGSAMYVLAEIQGSRPEDDRDRFAEILMACCEEGLASDATVSQSPREFQAIWRLREECSQHLLKLDNLTGFDIGIPLNAMGDFLNSAASAVQSADPHAQIFAFGHLGDGNLHYIVRSERGQTIAEKIFAAVARAGGAVSAEHGIGLDKKKYLPFVRSAEEMTTMRRLKAALDPNNILNPGRVFDMRKD